MSESNVDLFETVLDYKDIGKIIQQLRGDLCYEMQMKNIMDDILFEKIGRKYTEDDILKEQYSLNILEDETRIPPWFFNKQINYILRRKIIEVGGVWSPMSKLDTNYSAQALILGDLILMGKNDENCPFNINFNDIYNEVKDITPYHWQKTKRELYETIQKLKTVIFKIKDEKNSLKDIINYYFPNPQCFDKYSWKVLETTNIGDAVEKEFGKRIVKWGFSVESRGFNGSCVDIAFGIDFIVKRLRDGKKFTVQVKKSKPSEDDLKKFFDEKYIDIVVWENNNKIIIMNKERVTKEI